MGSIQQQLENFKGTVKVMLFTHSSGSSKFSHFINRNQEKAKYLVLHYLTCHPLPQSRNSAVSIMTTRCVGVGGRVLSEIKALAESAIFNVL